MSLMPSIKRDCLLGFAQLLRLPNVFTAFADIALGAAVTAAILPSAPLAFWVAMTLVALASGCLYLAGMVWNDVFDRAEDAVARPFRPIPSGRVSVRSAVLLGIALLALGMGLAALAGLPGHAQWNHEPLAYAIGITVAVLLYDGGLKRTPIGPVAMGSCRFLNVLFGLSPIPDELLDLELRFHIAGVVGIYIVGVTWFARTEEARSNRRQLIAATIVIALSLVLGLILKAKLPPGSGTFLFPYLLVAFGFLIGRPIARALASPGPREVQSAIKRAVLGLVVLDAVLATAFAGLPALAILLLLPPALLLGKWVYST
jgi:4-hydroxybenzoate polyprenyltransferase